VARALAEAGLPLSAAASADPSPDAQGWVTCGDLRVKGGAYGVDFTYTPGAVQYNWADYGTSDVVEVLTSAPLVFSDAAGHSKDAPGATGIQVNPGVHAAITLNGVHVSHQIPLNVMTHSLDTDNGTKAMECAQVRNRTSLYLVLADQSDNSLASSGGHRPGIRCGEGSDLVIDDAVRNLDAAGNMVIPIGGVINREVTLIDGKKLTANSTHTALDSRSPGVLTVSGSGAAAGIGGSCQESGGRITINGGKITASASYGGNDSDTGAGIGGGSGGNTTDTTLAINSGRIESHGGFHSAGIGAGAWNGNNFASLAPPDTILSRNYNYPLAGNIEINGGLITSVGGSHGGGFGTSCHGGTNAGNVIKVTGGTLRVKQMISVCGSRGSFGGSVSGSGDDSGNKNAGGTGEVRE